MTNSAIRARGSRWVYLPTPIYGPHKMSLHLVSDLEANKNRFVARVRESGVLWGLRFENGWAYCESNHVDADALLFWSDEAYAKRHAVGEWSAYQATAIDLAAFIERWLGGMQRDGCLAGVNFNADLAGLELQPGELALALTAER